MHPETQKMAKTPGVPTRNNLPLPPPHHFHFHMPILYDQAIREYDNMYANGPTKKEKK
jgi:hypothetical protein